MLCAKCQHDLGDAKAREAFICVEVMGDEYIYSYWRCDVCGFYTLETYRDRFMGSEIITVGDPIDAAEGEATVEFLRQCPEPNDKRCRCEVHQKMGYQSSYTPPADDTGWAVAAGEEHADEGGIEAETDADTAPTECPFCHALTTSLKRYRWMRWVLYVGITFRVRSGVYVACPRCMRNMVLKDTFSPLNILAANLMWIVVVLPYCLVLMVLSTLPGHSARVKRRLRGEE